MPARRGIGCVYASRFLDDERAHQILRDYVARTAGEAAAEALDSARAVLPHRASRGILARNCLAIGLSAGFIEPLEASAIVMIELSLNALVDNFPASAAAMPIHAGRFNALFRTRWDRVVEFLKLHYLLSQREEPYWRAQRDPRRRPRGSPTSYACGATSRHRPMIFPLAEEMFPAASYQYVYYGMGGVVPATPAAGDRGDAPRSSIRFASARAAC